MSPVCKSTGRIAFIGAGPGDAGMLTVRAQHLLNGAELLVIDPDVPAAGYAGVAAGTAVPAFAGIPLGSGHTEADVRAGVDWAALAAVPGPLVLHATASHLAETAAALIEHGVAAQTPVAVTAAGTMPTQHTIETTLASMSGELGELTGPLVVT